MPVPRGGRSAVGGEPGSIVEERQRERHVRNVEVYLFYLPSLGTRTDIEAGMAGAAADLYQQMLREVSEQCRLADALGYSR